MPKYSEFAQAPGDSADRAGRVYVCVQPGHGVGDGLRGHRHRLPRLRGRLGFGPHPGEHDRAGG